MLRLPQQKEREGWKLVVWLGTHRQAHCVRRDEVHPPPGGDGPEFRVTWAWLEGRSPSAGKWRGRNSHVASRKTIEKVRIYRGSEENGIPRVGNSMSRGVTCWPCSDDSQTAGQPPGIKEGPVCPSRLPTCRDWG